MLESNEGQQLCHVGKNHNDRDELEKTSIVFNI